MKKLSIIIFLFLSFQCFSQDTVTVKAVHDGDSYKVKFQDGRIRWIRLWGADAPEVQSPHVTGTQVYGREAGNNIRKLIKGKKVVIDSCSTDIFNRLVARVKLDSIDLTEYCIATGNAWWVDNDRIDPVELQKLKDLQTAAQSEKKGLWGMKGTKVRPSTFRKNHRKNQ
jgi:micrococcal nuclease